jgi:hypothetical protein
VSTDLTPRPPLRRRAGEPASIVSPSPTRGGRGPGFGASARWLLALLVFAATFWVFYDRAARVGYNTDEGQAIWPSQYFQFVFLEGRLGDPPWGPSYWTLTQVPVYRYIIGAGIWLSGNQFMELDLDHRRDEVSGPDRARYFDPATFKDERKLAEQRRVPRPSPDVLWAARLPMVLLGAGTAALLFVVTAELSGILGGVLAAAGFVAAPFVLTLLPRAHTEAPFLFFLVLGLWLSVLAARRAAGRPLPPAPAPLRWSREADNSAPRSTAVGRGRGWGLYVLATLAGLAVGLSAGSKLTGVLALAALGAFSAGAFVLGWLARRPGLAEQVGPRAALMRAWQWSALATVVGLVVFLAVNPFLWPDPVGRTRAMLEFRQQEMFGQRTLNEELAVPEGIGTRLAFLLRRSALEEPWAPRRLGIPVEAILSVVGLGVVAARLVQNRREGSLVGPEALTGAWLLVSIVGTAPNLGIDWDRYYLPIVALGLVFAGIGAEALVAAGRRAVSRRRAPTTTAATPPPIPTASSGSAG